MRNLTVYNRFAMIIAVLTVVFVAALAAQVMVLRNTVIEERRTKVFDLVEAELRGKSQSWQDPGGAGTAACFRCDRRHALGQIR